MIRYCSALFIYVLISFPVLGQAIFDAPVPVGPNIAGVQRAFVEDINGDDQQEIILGSTQFGEVVALSLTDDSVSSMQRLLPDGPSSFMDIADMNSDGIPDLIRSRIEGDSETDLPRIAVFLGQGDGTFSIPITAEGSVDYQHVAVADLTGDGVPEIILSGGPSIDVYTFDAGGEQIQLMRSLALPDLFAGTTTADITGDGVLDLIFKTGTTLQTIYAWDATTGSASPPFTIDTNVGPIGRISSADFNGDGLIDLFAGGSNEPQHSSYMVWTNLGGANFERSPLTYLGAWFDDTYQFRSIDGLVNMFFAGTGTGQLIRMQIYPDLTTGPLDTLTTVASEIKAFHLEDVNGDEIEDIVMITTDDRLVIALGSTTPFLFEPASEKFGWNHHASGPTVAVDPQGNGREQLAFLSNDSRYPPKSGFHLLKPDANEAVPVLTVNPTVPANWNGRQCHMYPVDIDNDLDTDLVGYQPNWGAFSPCQLFCMEDSNGTYVQRCIGDAISGVNILQAFNIGSFIVFDVNGDGLKDLLIAGTWVDLIAPQNQSQADYVLIQTTPAQFEIGVAPLPMENYLNHRDLDGDGLEELLVQSSPDELNIYHNIGNGAFTLLPAISTDHYVGSSGWADMNGDGILDEIWPQLDGDSIRVNFSTITLTEISQPTEILSMATPPYFIRVAALDLEGDGDMDILLSQGTTMNDPDSYDLFPYLNMGTYPLSRGDIIYHGTAPVTPIDADADGVLDLVTHRRSSFFLLKSRLQANGVDENSATRFVGIHPNPGTDNFTIDLPASIPGGTLILHDATGREVLRQRVSTGSAIVDTERLPAGLFTYRLVSTTGTEVRSGKWVKE